MSKKYSFMLIFSFVALTGFFSWILVMGELKKKGVDSRSEMEKSLLENELKFKKKSQAEPSKDSAQAVSPKPQAVDPPQPPVTEDQPNVQENVPEEEAVPVLKKFQSEKMGMMFDYPEGYEVEEKTQVVIVKKDVEIFRLKVYENKKKEEIQVWFEGNFKKKDNSNCVFSGSGVKIGTWESKDVKEGAAEGKCLDAGSYALISESDKAVGVFVQKEMDEEARKILESLSVLTL